MMTISSAASEANQDKLRAIQPLGPLLRSLSIEALGVVLCRQIGRGIQ